MKKVLSIVLSVMILIIAVMPSAAALTVPAADLRVTKGAYNGNPQTIDTVTDKVFTVVVSLPAVKGLTEVAMHIQFDKNVLKYVGGGQAYKVVDGDKLMEDALEAGAEDFSEDGDIYEITTEPDDFDAVKTDLEKKGYTFVSAEIEKVPSTYVTLTNEDDLKHMELLLDHLEEDEDIVNVWHNWDEQ